MASLHEVVADWTRWSVSADRSEPGWPSDAPGWPRLLELARAAMLAANPDAETVALLARCWAADDEAEELLAFAAEHIDRCWPLVERLAASTLPACRWQAYVAAASAGPKSEPLLRTGLNDADAYARRRAVLSLATLAPTDAATLARSFLRDSDPYIRQAAIEMVSACGDVEAQRAAFAELALDPVEHVRAAATARLRAISSESVG